MLGGTLCRASHFRSHGEPLVFAVVQDRDVTMSNADHFASASAGEADANRAAFELFAEPASAVATRGTAAPPQPRRIEEHLARQALTAPGKEAVSAGRRRLTYEGLWLFAMELAASLRALGVDQGDRVALYLDKTPEAVVGCYAVWLAGGVLVPTHEGARARQLDYILKHSGARALITSAAKLARFGIDPPTEVAVLEYTLPARPSAETDLPAFVSKPTEPAAILYTSGSTGQPKGILISHANLLAGARIVSGYLELRDDERIISIPPFSFDYGLNQLLCAVQVGATLVLQRSHMPADICRTLSAQAITGMAAVPPLWLQLLGANSPFPHNAYPHLRYITNTGGVFPKSALDRYRALLPQARVYLMYGLSEAFRSTYLPPSELGRRPTSIGKAIPECQIEVIQDGRLCGPGEVGELVHRGPTVALGYWRDPEATARVFRPVHWAAGEAGEIAVYSGDSVRKDEDGFLYFIGRRDTMIKTQGFRVSPDEIEELVVASGLVVQAAAVGQPDPVAGALIALHVVPKDQATFSTAKLLEFCRREMPRHMIPREIHTHDKLPGTGSGKIDRKGLAG